MASEKITRAELIILLRDTIRAEANKIEDEMNTDFVDSCMELLSILMEDECNLTDEQLEEKLKQIKLCKKPVPAMKTSKKMRVKFKQVAVFSAAIILICGGITIGAFNPTIHNMIMQIINFPIGTSVNQDGITYMYHGEMIVYPDIETLLENENLNIICPHGSTDDTQIKEIVESEDNMQIWVGYVDKSIYTTIYEAGNIDLSELISADVETYNTNGTISYIIERDGKFISTTLLNGWIYYINSNDKAQIIDILNSFK